MNLKLLTRLKTRDAAVVYEYLFERLDRSPGAIEGTSCERIAAELARDGIQTARGAAFSARVVRSKLDELEELEVVQRESIEGATFTLFVYLPYPRLPEDGEEKKPEPVDHYGGRTLFDCLPKTETKTETVLETEMETAEKTSVAINKENKVNNKKINKARLESKKVSTPKPTIVASTPTTSDGAEVGIEPTASKTAFKKPATDEIRSRINFADPIAAGLRKQIALDMWEPSTNPDLIDRVVALILLGVGGTKGSDVKSMIAKAKEARDRFERTDGRFGRERIWESVCYQTKRIYETNGWTWTPTRLGSEPRPIDRIARRRRVRTLDGKVVAEDEL